MKTKQFKWASMSLAILLLTGCANPIKTVQSENLNSSYDQEYWAKLAGNNPQEYNQAVAYCQHNTSKPNCPAVINTWFQLGYMAPSASS